VSGAEPFSLIPTHLWRGAQPGRAAHRRRPVGIVRSHMGELVSQVGAAATQLNKPLSQRARAYRSAPRTGRRSRTPVGSGRSRRQPCESPRLLPRAGPRAAAVPTWRRCDSRRWLYREDRSIISRDRSTATGEQQQREPEPEPEAEQLPPGQRPLGGMPSHDASQPTSQPPSPPASPLRRRALERRNANWSTGFTARTASPSNPD